MKSLYLTTLLLALINTTIIQASAIETIKCKQSKQEYLKAENRWSSLYTEESFLQDELNRLKKISKDAEDIIDVLHIASELLSTDKKLSKTEVTTLNIRIPKDRGVLYSDGSFAINAHKAKSLKESLDILNNISKWSSDGVVQMQKNLAYIHPQITQLKDKITSLESTISKVCTDNMILDSLQKDHISTNEQTIVNRFTQKEQQRYHEVSSRRWNDIERAWVYRYYNTCRFRPCPVW